MIIHHPELWALTHLIRYFCFFVTFFAFTANFLPSDKRLAHRPLARKIYLDAIIIIAFFGLNLRKRLPSAEVLEADSMDETHVMSLPELLVALQAYRRMYRNGQ